MRYEILGLLRVVDRDEVHFIGAPKVEALLAALLINSNQVVPVERLMTEIWGHAWPRRAAATFHVYVSQLRKFLRQAGRADNPIVTRQPGYLLRIGAGELDLQDFTRLVGLGRGCIRARRYEDARSAFQSALDLYRGPAIGNGRGGPIVNQFRTWLDEARLECTELLIEAELALGCHREMVGQLYSLTVENPFHETFYRQLMLALYRSERQADALKVYHNAQATLRGELGVEPCRGLRDLQRSILTADNRLELLHAG
jgi:SARP family transcriptional regulator, regulator of embCAB operon